MTDLAPYLGKNISAICGNGFNDNALNHCAHFASHAMGISLGYNCKQHMKGKRPGATIRVQELFAACPQVGVWPPPQNSGEVLAFVTAKSNVKLATKEMANVPRKHVGVLSGGLVYNYHNTQDVVGAETPDAFHKRMKVTYSDPDLGFWYGTLPGSGLALTGLNATTTEAVGAPLEATLEAPPAAAGAPAPISFTVSQDPANAKRWLAKADGGAAFFIGNDVPYQGRRGLNRLDNADPRYAAAGAYEARYGHWAWLIEVTGKCESDNRYAALNTYDTAAFTFGFFQMAAHTGADNLLALMRGMVALPNAPRYFPELKLVNNRLTKVDATGTTDLQAADEGIYTNLKTYLNPGKVMDLQEAINGARFVHWALNDPAFHDLQVETAFKKMVAKITKEVDPAKLDLDGMSDILVCIIFDILHQGRAKYTLIKQALKAADQREALITINAGYEERNNTLRAKLKALETAGKMGGKVYKRATMEFV